MKNRDVIFTGLQSWDIAIGSNAKNIALEMSLNNRVLYVNSPLSFSSKLRGEKIASKDTLQEVLPNLWVLNLPITLLPINKVGFGLLFDILNKHNNKRIASHILKIAKTLCFKNSIHINDNDIFRGFYMKDYLHPVLSIYYRRDWLLDVPYWRSHARRLEPILVEKSNMVLANSTYLADSVKEYNTHSYYVGQGVDLSLYDATISYPKPSELKDIKQPIIGYVGAINSLRLDADLIYDVAINMPHLTFVFVGSEDEYFMGHKIHQLSNVLFLGSRSPKTLPSYIQHFDVCINPQLVNSTTIGNYPRKIDEYLSMGKPVVATKTVAMEIFTPEVLLCSDTREYIEALEQSLKNNNSEAQRNRIALAHSHSWKNSVELMYKYINTLTK